MGEMFVYKGPGIGGGCLRSWRMQRQCRNSVKPVVGGAAARVGLWSGSVSVRCPHGPTLSQYCQACRRGWAQTSSHWRKTNVVSCGVM